MYRHFSFIIIMLYGLLVMSCTYADPVDDDDDVDDGLDPKTLSCTLQERNEEIVSIFLSDYYFNEDVTVPADYQVLPSSELVDQLKVKNKENYSFWVDDAFAFNQSFGQGVNTGKFGFRPIYIESDSGLVEDDRLSFYVIEKNSPAWNAGMRRGDSILSIDDVSKDQIFTFLKNNYDNKDLVSAYHYNLFGYDLEKEELTFVWESSEDQTIKTATIERASYTTDVVEAADAIENNDKTTGYFAYRAFAEFSENAIFSSFDHFDDESIDNIILDFRSNGGGSVRLAQIIVNSILNNQSELSGMPMLNFEYNQSRSQDNVGYKFWDNQYSIGAKDVVVLIDSSSCSASELVINLLKPYANVTIVGDQSSCGKPYSMHSKPICEGMLYPVTSKMTNAILEADYLEGFTPDCVVDDTLMYNWGDVNDPQIAEALHILNNGSCRTAPDDVISMPRSITSKISTKGKYFEQSTFDDYENPNTILFK